ncbi:unnamed protein product [Closterium sp. NIES-53]
MRSPRLPAASLAIWDSPLRQPLIAAGLAAALLASAPRALAEAAIAAADGAAAGSAASAAAQACGELLGGADFNTVVAVTCALEFIALTGAAVGGYMALQQGAEMERINKQLRQINMSLKRQARLDAPSLTYSAPPPSAALPAAGASSMAEAAAVPAAEAPADAARATAMSQTAQAASDERAELLRILKEGKKHLRDGHPGSAFVEFHVALSKAKELGDAVEEKKAARGLAPMRCRGNPVCICESFRRPSPAPTSPSSPSPPHPRLTGSVANIYDDNASNASFANDLRRFSYRELQAATGRFRRGNLLGEGSFGKVYRGSVPDWLGELPRGQKRKVAIKVLDADSFQGFGEWMVGNGDGWWVTGSEVLLLGRLSHPNLVRLLGYSTDREEAILVYELLSNGSLDAWLFSDDSSSSRVRRVLTWEERVRIAVDATMGLAHLHAENIIHRDFKSCNILLDHSMRAKLTDFGMATVGPEAGQTHISTRVLGTMGYLDPKYLETGHLTPKSDIYALGVVYLELLTGRPPSSDEDQDANGEGGLTAWIRPHISVRRPDLDIILDPRLKDQFSRIAAQKLLVLAKHCISEDPVARPQIQDLVKSMQHIVAIGHSRSHSSGSTMSGHSRSASLVSATSGGHSRSASASSASANEAAVSSIADRNGGRDASGRRSGEGRNSWRSSSCRDAGGGSDRGAENGIDDGSYVNAGKAVFQDAAPRERKRGIVRVVALQPCYRRCSRHSVPAVRSSAMTHADPAARQAAIVDARNDVDQAAGGAELGQAAGDRGGEWAAVGLGLVEVHLAANESPASREKRIRALFQTFDTENRGALTRRQIERGLARMGVPVDYKFSKDLLAAIDQNGDGVCDYNEFHRYMDSKEVQLYRLFQRIDTDFDGAISLHELAAALHHAGIHLAAGELQAFMEKMDRNHDGVLSFNEWRDFLLLFPHRATSIATAYQYWERVQQVDIGEQPVIPSGLSASLSTAPDASALAWRYFLAGGVAGAVSRTATAPLDRLKVLLQCAKASSTHTPPAAAATVATAAVAPAGAGAAGGARGAAAAVAVSATRAAGASGAAGRAVHAAAGGAQTGAPGGGGTRGTVAAASTAAEGAAARSGAGGRLSSAAIPDAATSAGHSSAATPRQPSVSPPPQPPLQSAAAPAAAQSSSPASHHPPPPSHATPPSSSASSPAPHHPHPRHSRWQFSLLRAPSPSPPSLSGPPSALPPNMPLWWQNMQSGRQATIAGRQQVAHGRLTLWRAVQQVYGEGGVGAFFKGNGINVVKVAPESAIKFYAYELLKRAISLPAAAGGAGAAEKSSETALTRLVAGGMAGAVAQTAVYPLDLVKTRLQTYHLTYGRNPPPLAALTAEILQREGAGAMFRGLLPSILGMIPFAGIDLAAYETLRDAFTPWIERRPEAAPVLQLACGTVSATVAATLVFPLQVIRTRLQAHVSAPHAPSSTPTLGLPAAALSVNAVAGRGPTMGEVTRELWQEGGVHAFFRGVLPNLLKVVPAASITYVTYEHMKKVLALN